jgi:hypothetical protein
MSRENAKRIDVDAKSVKRNPWIMALGASPLLMIPVLGVLALVYAEPGFLAGLPFALLFGALGTLHTGRQNYRPLVQPAELRVDDDNLFVGGDGYPLTSFKRGYLVPQGDHSHVRLVRGRFQSNVEIAVADWDSGQRVLRDLGFGLDEAVGRFRTPSRLSAHPVRTMAGVFAGVLALSVAAMAFMDVSPTAVVALFMAVALTAGALSATPTKLDIGADGLLLRWLGRDRFIPYDDIEMIAQRQRGNADHRIELVDVKLESGDTYVIPIGPGEWDSGEADAIYARIYAAIDQHRRRVPVHSQALIDRGKRSHLDWAQSLRSRMEVGAHRRAAVSLDALWRTIEDHGSRAIDRAASAVALGEHLSDADRTRLKRISNSVASPKLRIAIERVAEDSQVEAVAEALEALDEADATSIKA